MSKNGIQLRTITQSCVCLALLLAACGKPQGPVGETDPIADTACEASASWITSPNPPAEIGDGIPVGDETNCQFHQFEWQWFLALVQPQADAPGERVFETYPIYQPGKTDQCASDPVTGQRNLAKALAVRTGKDDATFDPVLPKDIGQATGQALYDQGGNVVYYTIQYSPSECQGTATGGFPPNTTEIKAAWRVLKEADPNYYTIEATILEVSSDPLTLGLVGFQLVMSTKNHPEFVWATFEHKTNAPDCTDSGEPDGGWSFTSPQCAQCLKTKSPAECTDCKFNTGINPPPGLTSDPTEVCRVYPDGTDPESMTGGNDNDTNRANIDALNEQLVGPGGFLTKMPADSPMAVWKNYSLIGGLWTNGGVGSKVDDAQRGSLELANMTMETFFQQPQHNCFTCHNYDPATPLDVSHIVSGLLPATN